MRILRSSPSYPIPESQEGCKHNIGLYGADKGLTWQLQPPVPGLYKSHLHTQPVFKKRRKKKKEKKKSCGAVIILLPIENNVDYIVLALFIHVWILQLQTWLHFTNCYAHMIIKLHLYWGIYKQGTWKITRDTCSLSAEQNQVHKPGYRVITWKIIHHYRTLIIFS